MLRQYGAIPFTFLKEEPLVLMITSRTHERWIFPKGGIEKHETPVDAAHREAFEEAGVRGHALADYPHEVRGHKQLPDGLKDMLVTYFPLHLKEQADDWPERKRRDRHWVTMADARKIAGGEDILLVLQGFQRFLPKLYSIASAR
ncbi:MAG: NUDIX hydrolase [Parvibaculum sp.]